MKAVLTVFCLMVLGVMLAATVAASLHQNILKALTVLLPDPWFRATLADTYFAFLFFWLWLAWREDSLPAALTWLILILVFGNFAMAGYVLLALRCCSSVDDLFRRKVRPAS
jgi:uncharacterized membrane protein required for colicin V production